MIVKPGSRVLAFLAYLLVVVGGLFVLLFNRNDEFAVYHARQSLAVALAAVAAPVVWVVLAWLLSWIPQVGPVVAAATFALVVAAYFAVIVAWIVGMVNALRSQCKPAPIFGGWAAWLQRRLGI